ncbi:hypothetical protein BDQ17DRAFT_775670 [Cyathus striatus]|nr:hypothetical protein BDQ17DRAFT_775670 [Cyathus striatus]
MDHVRLNLISVSVGWTLSLALYGIACGQTAHYFYTYSRDLKRVKAFVYLAILFETMQCALPVRSLWHTFILRAVNDLDRPSISIFFATGLPTEATCFLVECFFLMRMWQFTCSKTTVTAAVIPFVLGWGFNIVYIRALWLARYRPDTGINFNWIYPSYGFRIISDGIMAGIMCYHLYRKQPDSEQRIQTVRLIRSLIIWTVASGLLMWLCSIAFLITYKFMPDTRLSIAIYSIRGRIYANTMLTLLNSRERRRDIDDGTIALETLNIPMNSVAPDESIPAQAINNISRVSSSTSSHDTEKSMPVHIHPMELQSLTDDFSI